MFAYNWANTRTSLLKNLDFSQIWVWKRAVRFLPHKVILFCRKNKVNQKYNHEFGKGQYAFYPIKLSCFAGKKNWMKNTKISWGETLTNWVKGLLTKKKIRKSNIILEVSRYPNFTNPFELGQSFIGKWFPKRIGTLTPSNPKIFILFIVHFSFIWTCKTEDIMRLRHRNGGTFGITIYRNMTMNGNTYNDLLVNSVIPELKRINGGVLEPLVWQQDKGVGD